MYISLYLFITYLTFGKMQFLGVHGILLKNNCYFWWTIYIFKFKIIFFMWMGICLNVYLCIMSMPAEFLIEYQVFWKWRYLQVCGYWESNLDTFEELLVLLTAESSLQEYVFISLTIKGFEYLIFCVLLFLLQLF